MTAADRQRRYRRRQRKGVTVLRVPARLHCLVAALIESGRLTATAALDPERVEEAAAAVLVEWASRWR